ncbi:MAG: polysaccharide biosynthesis tyrosine autokinase [Anaerolineae bacterium]|nr:polysaccharide biosynthesis tyrosine autokinase [Gloeobacterales cyanobacterium ES-bin-313]
MNEDFLPQNNLPSPGKSTDGLVLFLRVLRKRWLLSILVLFAVVGGTIIYTAMTVPVYESSTAILVENRRAVSVLSTTTTDPSEAPGFSKDYSTEIQILKSLPLLEQSVHRLKAPYNKITAGDIASHLSVNQFGDAGVLMVTFRDNDPVRIKAVLDALGATYVDYSLQNKRSLATNALKFVEEQLPDAQRKLQQSSLALEKFRERNRIVDPETYATELLTTKQTLNQQEKDAQIALNKSTSVYNKRRSQLGKGADEALTETIISQDPSYQNLIKQYNELQVSYVQERTRFKDEYPTVKNIRLRRDRIYALIQQRAQQVLGQRLIASEPGVGVADALPQVADGAPNATVENLPQYQSIQQGLAGELLTAQAEILSKQVEIQSIRRVNQELEQSFAKVPSLQLAYTELQRKFKIDSDTIDFLLKKRQELKVAEAQETSPWRVLNPAIIPESPIIPNTSRNLTLGVLAGLLIAVGTTLLLERLDERIKEVDEVKEIAQIPLLGVIPRVTDASLEYAVPEERNTKNGRRTASYNYNRSPFREALRSLAFNLRYLGADKKVKLVLITSSVPGEGKSTITYNLSTILAEAGFTVLLIDADMRKPTIHKLLEVPNTAGLSSVLAGEKSLDEVLHIAKQSLDLTVITSGPLPPDPVSLLDSSKMAAVLETCRERYNYVLIDMPPVVGLSDAQVLFKKTDATIVVTGLGRSTRSSLQRAMEIVTGIGGATLVGSVVNFLDNSNEGYYYQYYSSYYGDPSDPEQNEVSTGERRSKRNVFANIFKRR